MSGENPQQMSSGPASPRWVSGGMDRSEVWTPIKTAEGRAEISRRSRALNQRLRTVLLLIDGRRTISQIRSVAVQVGAPDTCLDDLLDMGLVALPEPIAATTTAAALPAEPVELAATVVPAATSATAPVAEPEPAVPETAPMALQPAALAAPTPEPEAAPETELNPAAVAAVPDPVAAAPVEPVAPIADVASVEAAANDAAIDNPWAEPDTLPFEPSIDDIRIAADDGQADDTAAASASSKRLTNELFEELVRATPRRDAEPSTIDSTLRTSTSGRLDSMMSSLYPLLESAFGNPSRLPSADRPQDDALEEARRILMREVRSKAPVTGALTLVKLRRATTREELTALFDEVGSHISLPMRRLSTQQILLHVKSLLTRPM